MMTRMKRWGARRRHGGTQVRATTTGGLAVTVMRHGPAVGMVAAVRDGAGTFSVARGEGLWYCPARCPS
jgi:hypothetical protein